MNLPLSLYIHIPWCVQKCPYCDFNSHQQKGDIPEKDYIFHLLADLEQDLARFKKALQQRPLQSIFIGGGTPSLLSAQALQYLLSEIAKRIAFAPQIEITLEANPGTLEIEKFTGFVEAGVTRLSMGVQSFADDQLKKLGRIHDARQAITAIQTAQSLRQKGLKSFNLDLMHGLPGQTLESALADLKQAIALNPPHLSWYQLTIEPNTLFGSRPPKLPDEDELWAIFEKGDQLLRSAGYEQYETSAYAKKGFQCAHNLNYWRFGDYLAIGCGAHGKISDVSEGQLGEIWRFSKTKHPKGYLQGQYLHLENKVSQEDLAFEYFMNRFRLLEAVPKAEFLSFTGLTFDDVALQLEQAKKQGYIQETATTWQVTEHGKLFLNELLELFL